MTLFKSLAFFLIAFAGCLFSAPTLATDAVTVYPAPPLPLSREFEVTVNGIPIPVINAGSFRCAPFAFMGEVTVEVTYRGGAIDSYAINPLSKGIVARQNGNTLCFTLRRPEKLEVQINGATSQVADGDKLLYLFADAPEPDAPSPKDPAILYFGPGNHKVPNGLLKIDDTDPHSAMYLAPGAVLNASLEIKRKKPFRVFGRGFIRNIPDDPAASKKSLFAIALRDCVGVKVEDVAFFDSNWHGIKIFGGHENLVRNVKALHLHVNSDGISLHYGASNNLVENCFIIGNDNLIVIGGVKNGKGVGGNLIRGCTFIKSSYAGNWAFPQGDGPIGAGNVVDDCDVIRCNGEVALIRAWWGNLTTVENLTFQNIRVQSLAGYAPKPEKTHENRFLSIESGNPENERTFTLKNIYLPSPQTSWIVSGRWKIIFDHVYVAGKAVQCDADLNLTKGEGVITKYIY